MYINVSLVLSLVPARLFEISNKPARDKTVIDAMLLPIGRWV